MNRVIKDIVDKSLLTSNFDTIEVATLDFNTNKFVSYFNTRNPAYKQGFYFDLASLTKPLTLAHCYLKVPKLFDKQMKLLLNHRAGLPPWGRLSRSSWRDQILSYQIKESQTLYSDFSALRLQLEIEKSIGSSLYEVISDGLDQDVIHWLDVSNDHCISTGQRNRAKIYGEVHDDNAFVIGEKISHAGLFGSAAGLSSTLLNLNNKYDLLEKMNTKNDHRFMNGFDTVEDPSTSLASEKASRQTFGHLGFTGTSFYIEPASKKGVIILTNETLGFWYNRTHLNNLRREIHRNFF